MKTATVADLRNRFSQISDWILEGEEVTITKRGKPFATLSSAKRPKAHHKPLNRLARLKELNPAGRYDGDSTEELRMDRDSRPC
jgi:prevent-host-death family protein